MAKSASSTYGTVWVPSTYTKYFVRSNPTGLAANGILLLVGESTNGPDFSQEDDLELTCAFGADQFADVVNKYGSGPLVDAFRGAVTASGDDQIGAFSQAILVKTNASAKAEANLLTIAGGTYTELADKNYGTTGNLIGYQVTASTAEVQPAIDEFSYIPAGGTVNAKICLNGVAASLSLGANTSPSALVSAINALSWGSPNITATGGAEVTLFGAGPETLTLAVVSGNDVTLTTDGTWANNPEVGGTFLIPGGSDISAAGTNTAPSAAGPNVGAYVITAVTSSVITATKLSDAGRTGWSAGVITPPQLSADTTSFTNADVIAYDPITIAIDAQDPIDGVSKRLEIAELTTGTDLLSRCLFDLGTDNQVDWLSSVGNPTVTASSAEYAITLDLTRTRDAIIEEYTVGGEIAMTLAYSGSATGTVTISDTALTTSTAAGGAANLNVLFSQYNTLQEVVDRINTFAGYTATLVDTGLASQHPEILDRVTAAGIYSPFEAAACGIKTDAYRLNEELADSVLAQLGNTAGESERADAGLPDATAAVAYLAGGTWAGTTNSNFSAALTALEGVTGNFLIPLFSRNASSDVTDGLTDSTSTYTIATINAAAKSHVLAMSEYLKQAPRQAFCSLDDTFVNQKTAAKALASAKVSLAMMGVKDLDASGEIVTFEPWMSAVKAASMQAGGGYRNIENKLVNCSGVVHLAGDYNPKSNGQVTQALKAGLLTMKKDASGGFMFVSDQTTYGLDSNFVYNSIQAVYAADTISRTLSEKCNRSLVGQSVADVSAAVAATFIESIMAEFLRLKLIAPSDDALKGYRGLKVRIVGNVMRVFMEIKLATAIDFILIEFAIAPVTQTA